MKDARRKHMSDNNNQNPDYADIYSADLPALLAIMKALRTPETGCPWDLEQDFSTIAPYTIEEAYEVADAIERNDFDDLCDELGDLLLQVVYHAQMAKERSKFSFEDVVAGVCAKMIRRHPHVFGDAGQRDIGQVKGMWEKIKDAEKSTKKSKQKSDVKVSALDGVPVPLPPLTRALKLQQKAARVGFDWENADPVFDKILEELDEVKSELARASVDQKAVEAEIGDVLFSVTNLARHLNVNPETALRNANIKFTNRFHSMEQAIDINDKKLDELSINELEELWLRAKQLER